jgi:hypothetical protein
MIAVPAGVRVLVWSSPVDFRKGMDGLSAYVQVTLKADAFGGICSSSAAAGRTDQGSDV